MISPTKPKIQIFYARIITLYKAKHKYYNQTKYETGAMDNNH